MGSEAITNFTPRAQQVIALARKEADRLKDHSIGTEHLLLGLIALGKGVAVTVLENMGLNLETLRLEMEKQSGGMRNHKPTVNLPITPRVKKVIAFAQKEAGELGHSLVGTEHLLLGVLREGSGAAVEVLAKHKVDWERAHQEVLKEIDPNLDPGRTASKKSSKPQEIKGANDEGASAKGLGQLEVGDQAVGRAISGEEGMGVNRNKKTEKWGWLKRLLKRFR